MKRILTGLMSVLLLVLSACSPAASGAGESFAQQRMKGTALVQENSSPQSYDQDSPPEGAIEISFPSGEYSLKAWITVPPGDGKKHPAVVYAHGGFAFGLQDWLDAQPYVEAGYQVMVPMLRGENGNPGSFELCFGEVDDVIAAGEYLAKQTYIDDKRLFLSGHSSGGTLALLAAMLPSPYAAVAAFDGAPDIRKYEEGALSAFIPFRKEQREYDLRSAYRHANDLAKPLFIYIPGEGSSLSQDNRAFSEEAKSLGKTCEVYEINGDHISMLPGCISASIQIFGSLSK